MGFYGYLWVSIGLYVFMGVYAGLWISRCLEVLMGGKSVYGYGYIFKN